MLQTTLTLLILTRFFSDFNSIEEIIQSKQTRNEVPNKVVVTWKKQNKKEILSDIKMSGCHHWTPVLGLLLFLLLSMVLARPEAGWSSSLPRGQQITSSQQTQQTGNGGLLPFPEGKKLMSS